MRDYMLVDDHVDAYIKALEDEGGVGEVFNVSPGNPITNFDLAKRIAEVTDFKGRVVDGSYPPSYPARPQQWDTEYIVLDSSKITRRLGWRPSVSLDEGLDRTVALWKRQGSL